MAASLLQTTAKVVSAGSGSTQDFSFAAGVPAGAAIILPFVNYSAGVVSSVTDNFSNTYQLAVTNTSRSSYTYIWYSIGITSDGTTPLVVTATLASSSGNYNTGAAQAWSGITAIDATGSAGEGSPTVTAGAANSQADGVAIVCTAVTVGTADAALGFTSPGWSASWVQNEAASVEGGQGGYRVISGSETTAVTIASTSANLISVLATFKATAGSAALAGDAAAVATATGALTTGIALAGSAAALATSTGALTTGIALTGAALAAATSTGALSTSIALGGGAAVTATSTGDLSAASTGLAGDAASVATSTGDLTTGIALAADSFASAIASGNLTTVIAFAGQAMAVAASSGQLSGGASALPAPAFAPAFATPFKASPWASGPWLSSN